MLTVILTLFLYFSLSSSLKPLSGWRDELSCKSEQVVEKGEYFGRSFFLSLSTLGQISCFPQEAQTFPCPLWSRSRQPLGVIELSLFGVGSFLCLLENGGKFPRSDVVTSACTEMTQSEVLAPVLTPLFISFLPQY